MQKVFHLLNLIEVVDLLTLNFWIILLVFLASNIRVDPNQIKVFYRFLIFSNIVLSQCKIFFDLSILLIYLILGFAP